MKIYFAGTLGIEPREDALLKLIKRRLISYYYIDKGLAVRYGFNKIIKSKKK